MCVCVIRIRLICVWHKLSVSAVLHLSPPSVTIPTCIKKAGARRSRYMENSADSNFEVNMVAQPDSDPGRAVAEAKQADPKEHNMSTATVDGPGAQTAGDAGFFHLTSSGASSQSKDSELSGSISPFAVLSSAGPSSDGAQPLSAPPGLGASRTTARKRASSLTVPTKRQTATTGTLQAPRLSHRRVSPAPPAGSGAGVYPAQQHDKIKQLEDQSEADREAISAMRDAIMDMHGQLALHDNAIKRFQNNDININKNIISVESSVLKRVEDAKSFMTKNLDSKIASTERRIFDGVERELINKNTLSKFLIGQPDNPVLQPLVADIMKEKIADIDNKFMKLHDFMNERHEKEAQVQVYLDNLKEQRPEEGKVVKDAFSNVAVEIPELRASLLLQAQASGTNKGPSSDGAQGASSVAAHTSHDARASKSSSEAPETTEKLEAVRKELVRLNSVVLQNKCHCTHVDALDHRLNETNSKIDVHTRALSILEKSIEQLRSQASSSNTAQVCAACSDDDNDDDDDWGTFKRKVKRNGCGNKGCGDKDCGGDDNGDPAWFTKSAHGGNGTCHCVHVSQIRVELDILKLTVDEMNDGSGGVYDGSIGSGHRRKRNPPQPLPLKIGAIGQLHDANAKLFDDRQASQPGFQFDGSRGGVAWKCKLENYFIAKCPALMEILSWAEKFEGESIDSALLSRATQGTDMDNARMENANASIWGFLGNCVSAEAHTIFLTSPKLQGIDVWRKIIRFIDHGKDIKLESMRDEMKIFHTKKIKNLEQVPIGIAKYELKIKDWHDIGGTPYTEEEMKSDLVKILPERLQTDLLWRASDPGPYSRFRDMIKTQAARTLLNQQRLPTHLLQRDQLQEPSAGPSSDGAQPQPTQNGDKIAELEELLAVMKRRNGPGGDSRNRGPRKCANCGGEHEGLKCPHPPVPVSERKCWTCGKTGHSNADCPQRKSKQQNNGKNDGRKGIKSLEEELEGYFQRLATVTTPPSPGDFQRPKKTVKSRPMPQGTNIGDHIDKAMNGGKYGFHLLGSLNNAKMSQKAKKEEQARVSRLKLETPCMANTGISSDIAPTPCSPCTHTGSSSDDAPTCKDTGKPDRASGNLRMPKDLKSIQKIEDAIENELEKLGMLLDDAPGRGTHRKGEDTNAVMNKAVDEAIGAFELKLLRCADGPCQELLELAPATTRVTVAADTGAVRNVINPKDLPRGAEPNGVINHPLCGRLG